MSLSQNKAKSQVQSNLHFSFPAKLATHCQLLAQSSCFCLQSWLGSLPLTLGTLSPVPCPYLSMATQPSACILSSCTIILIPIIFSPFPLHFLHQKKQRSENENHQEMCTQGSHLVHLWELVTWTMRRCCFHVWCRSLKSTGQVVRKGKWIESKEE